MSRWNANTVLLAVFVLILIGAGVDYGRRVLGEGKTPTEIPTTVGKKPSAPDFEVGDTAPDFALPDAKKKSHKLSELVKQKTMLFFACGCNNCKQVQSWLTGMTQSKEFPKVITVTSAPPEAEAAWLRDTQLKQTMLYWTAGVSPDPMTIYHGKPCPRIYILNEDRTVKFIGSSLEEGIGAERIGMEVAKEVGGSPYGAPSAPRKSMPTPPKLPSEPKPSPDLPPYAQPQSALPGMPR